MHNYKVVEYFPPDSDNVLCDSTRWVDHGGYGITLMSVPRQGEGKCRKARKVIYPGWGSNPRPPACKSGALPTELPKRTVLP